MISVVSAGFCVEHLVGFHISNNKKLLGGCAEDSLWCMECDGVRCLLLCFFCSPSDSHFHSFSLQFFCCCYFLLCCLIICALLHMCFCDVNIHFFMPGVNEHSLSLARHSTPLHWRNSLKTAMCTNMCTNVPFSWLYVNIFTAIPHFMLSLYEGIFLWLSYKRWNN